MPLSGVTESTLIDMDSTSKVFDTLRKEIYKLHRALPWGACASQTSMKAYCKDEAYKEVLRIINKLEQDEEVKQRAEKMMSCAFYVIGGECSKALPCTLCDPKGCVAWRHYEANV